VGGLLAAALLAGAAPAHAATLIKVGTEVRYTAQLTEANNVTVTLLTTGGVTYYEFAETTIAITASSGCFVPSANHGRCAIAGVTSLRIDLLDANNTAVVSSGITIPATMLGGAGIDTFTGGAGNDTLNGGGSNDSLNGGNGNDTFETSAGLDSMNGAAGNDVFLAGSVGDGADTVDGGAGTDTMDYSSRSAAIGIELDNAADDGQAGELDNVRETVEIGKGGSGNDTLLGTTCINTFLGNSGNDVISGAGGANPTVCASRLLSDDDVLEGGAGNDTLNGLNGEDLMRGGSGADAFNGGAGTDTADFSSEGVASRTITIDGTANDGASGEGDNVALDVEIVVGSSGNDSITGRDDRADTIRGGPGNDSLTGLGGNDSLFGDAGGDTFEQSDAPDGGDSLSGGADFDWVDYGDRSSSESVTVSIDGNANDGDQPLGSENDNVQTDIEGVRGSAGSDTITGSLSGDDQLLGGAGSDTLSGSGGNDKLVGRGFTHPGEGSFPDDGENALFGGEGNDELIGNDDNDDLRGGSGDDSLDGGSAGDFLSGEAGNDLISGSFGDDEIVGWTGDDTIYGGPDNDEIDAGDGNDWINGGTEGDDMHGGLGTDTVTYQDPCGDSGSEVQCDPVTVTLDDATNDGRGGNDNVRSDVENVIGGTGDDTITGTAGVNYLDGYDGNDTINGLGGNDTLDGTGRDPSNYTDNDTLNGGTGNDVLTGGKGTDALNGESGDDAMDGGPGADVFNGGSHNLLGGDTVTYAARSAAVTVVIDGSAGDGEASENDRVSSDVEHLVGGSGGDTLRALETDNVPNTFSGGNGNDLLDGGGSVDSLNGDGGNDTLDGGDGAVRDLLNGGAGTDTADYSARAAAVTADLAGTGGDGQASENDQVGSDVENLTGGSGNDSLTGSSLANLLAGGNGNDTLSGLDGNDTLDGGLGSDVMLGGGNGAAAGDLVDYSSRAVPVTADLDGVKDDGQAGELDQIGSDVESLRGGSAGDVLGGNGNANRLMGGPGNDLFPLGSAPDGADTVNGNDGVDTADYSARSGDVSVILDGTANDGAAGEGDLLSPDLENLTGGSGDDALTGSSDVNRLLGGAGNDALSGADGNDTMDGGAGGDAMAGGPGSDVVDYTGRSAPLVIDLDGVADDGEAGEGDNVAADVDVINGGSGNDVITGGAIQNVIDGKGGDDLLDGAGDNDTIFGSAGNDTLLGDVGKDSLVGGDDMDTADYSARTAALTIDLDDVDDDGEAGEGDNVSSTIEIVLAGSGNDSLTGNVLGNTLVGNGGTDSLTGLAGDDRLLGRDGVDGEQLNCGDGAADIADRDAGDNVTGCETILQPPTNDGPVPSVTPADPGVGDVVTASPGGWSGAPGITFAYQWLRCDGGTCVDIAGASAQTYEVIAADLGKTLRVRVTATNPDGAANVLSPETSGVVMKFADLSVDLGASTTSPLLRGLLTYSVTVQNGGPNRATNVVLADDLPAALTFVSAAPAVCTGPDPVTCDVGDLDPGASFELDLVVRTKTSGRALNEVGVSAEQDDPDADDVSDVVSVTVSQCTMRGTTGANRLTGTTGNDVICGLGGNDTIDGRGGVDVIFGGTGNDTLTGGPGRDTLKGEAGNDTFQARDSFRDSVIGGAGRDRARVDLGRDTRSSIEVLF
jgi:uncharacterized repeat protein (TIGR01451 family)